MFEVERPRLEKAALLALRRAAVLVEEAECALLRLEASGTKAPTSVTW